MMADPFKGWICKHDHYNMPLGALADEVDRALNGGEPFMFTLLGQSRAGKSEVLKDVEARYSSNLSPSGHPQVIRVPMPTVLNKDALAYRIIEKVLGTADVKGSPRELALRLLQDAGVIVMLLDEINHLAEARRSRAAQSKENRGLGDWIKEIFDISRVSIGLSGLPHSLSILVDNEQLEARALRPVHLRPYDWSLPSEQLSFRQVVLAFATQLKVSGWTIEAHPEIVTRGAYVCGGGLVGRVRDIFHRAAELGERTKRLDLPLLARAYEDRFSALAVGNPFKLATLTDVLLNEAHRRTLVRGQAPTFQEKTKAASARRGGR
jgi:hypothetical protein